MVLLDTNILIYFFKGQGNVGKRLLATSPQKIAVSCVTLLNWKQACLNPMQARYGAHK